jgi:hypothetical protein
MINVTKTGEADRKRNVNCWENFLRQCRSMISDEVAKSLGRPAIFRSVLIRVRPAESSIPPLAIAPALRRFH